MNLLLLRSAGLLSAEGPSDPVADSVPVYLEND